MKTRKNEQGAVLIVEATLVFPVMFFVILFLIYLGNVYYMRSQVDEIVATAAVKGAALRADPLLYDMVCEDEENPKLPEKIKQVKPYYNLSDNGAVKKKIYDEVNGELNSLGDGFFAGMGIRDIKVNSKMVNNNLINPTFTVEASYTVKMPIKLLGENNPRILSLNSIYTVPITNTQEMVQTIDMLKDYSDRTGVTGKVNEWVGKIKALIKGNK